MLHLRLFIWQEKVKAKKKVSWLHSILSRFNPQSFKKWYEQMDVIFACSQMVKTDFDNIFPNLGNVRIFYNIINPENVRLKSKGKGGFTDDFDGIRILTVGE